MSQPVGYTPQGCPIFNVPRLTTDQQLAAIEARSLAVKSQIMATGSGYRESLVNRWVNEAVTVFQDSYKAGNSESQIRSFVYERAMRNLRQAPTTQASGNQSDATQNGRQARDQRARSGRSSADYDRRNSSAGYDRRNDYLVVPSSAASTMELPIRSRRPRRPRRPDSPDSPVSPVSWRREWYGRT